MKKSPLRKLPPVIPAPPELLAKMQRLFDRPPVSFEVMKAQTDRVLQDRNDGIASNRELQSGRSRKAG